MKKSIKTLNLMLSLSLGFILFTACDKDDDAEPTISQEYITTSQFQTDAEGWIITGDAQGGYTEASYSPDGGVLDGYIYADDDVAGGVWYFTSPNDYHGNKTEYYGATLKYSLFQESNRSNQFESADIIFRNGTDQITYVYSDPSKYPTDEWTDYSINISAGNGWLKGAYDSGVEATEADIKAVLSNVTEFSIRGEFESGADTGGMDNVIILNP